MEYLSIFKMPNQTKIKDRTSSVTNAFVNGIIPRVKPTEEEVKKVVKILDMDEKNIRCAYCGDKCTEWDHFRPLVEGKKPTGYITEINNLVPACGKCNQSKGNKNWRKWILSDAKLSPKTKNVPDLELRIKRLEEFEKQSNPIKLDFERIVGEKIWKEHWDNCDKLHNQMKECQKLSDKIQKLILNELIKNENVKAENTDLYIDKKVGIIAKQDLKYLLELNKLPKYIIGNLQDLEYCKETFDVNFPVLLKIKSEVDISAQRKDHLGYTRYYATPLTIYDEKYFLTSEWYDKNRQKLIEFIQKYLNEN